ncbi:MAG: SAM hydrolase/SAM-dependent halogenase family protein [Acidimicrobiia bacterium]
MRQYISFLSDYGLVDEFVGVCKAVMLSVAPEAHILDVTHDVPPYDVRSGALTLARAVQYLPAGVVLAVVDPGVGSERRAVAAEVETGHLVGPDNGLLAPAVAVLGGARRVVSLDNTEYQLDSPGPTFAGRDVMAPAAGHLAAGGALEELGTVVDPLTLIPGMMPLSRPEDGGVAGEVLWVDRFGNAQLNIDPDELGALGLRPGSTLQVRVGTEQRMARWVAAYADAQPLELALVVDSYGLVALAYDRRPAAEGLSLGPGSAVKLLPGGAG